MAALRPDVAQAQQNAQAQVNGIVQHDAEKNRVAVHSFNPDATPQEKAAAAEKNKDQLKSVTGDRETPGVKGACFASSPCSNQLTWLAELSIDPGHPDVIPTSTVEDADVAGDNKDDENDAQQQQQPQHPGTLPANSAPVIPDWYKVGWRAVSGIDEQLLAEGEAKQKYILDAFIKEQYYGDWYHSAGLIVCVSAISWLCHLLST